MLKQDVTAKLDPTQTQIFWLDTLQGEPITLTTRTLQGEHGHYQTEYRWLNGVVREIQQTGKVLFAGELRSQSFLIRYDSEGQAVYQQHHFDDEVRPIHLSELNQYYAKAKAALLTAQTQLKKNQVFFQGYWREGVFETCFDDREVKLDFGGLFSTKVYARLKYEDNYIAAIGTQGLGKNKIYQLIALEPESADCITRPLFDDE